MDWTSLVPGAAALLLTAAALARWMSDLTAKRIIHGWERRQKDDAEFLRSEREKYQAIFTASVQQFSAGQQALYARRLQAIETVWERVIALGALRGVTWIVYASKQPDALLEDTSVLAILRELDSDENHDVISDAFNDLERHRPFVGEELHSLALAYFTMLSARVASVRKGVREGSFTGLIADEWVRLLSDDLPPSVNVRGMNDEDAMGAIKKRITALIGLILSGERSASETFEHSTSLLRALRDAQGGDSILSAGTRATLIP